MNSDKILPLRVLARCAELFIRGEDSKLSESISEQIQAKFMAVILREFRKNMEYTRFIQEKRSGSLKKQGAQNVKNIVGSTGNSRKPIVNDLFNK
jgi:hypothetical protein